MSLTIAPFTPAHIPQAAALFVAHFQQQRAAVPVLPDRLADAEWVAKLLDNLLKMCPALVMLDGERLLGYLGWYIVNDFRHTGRRAAYCPEWAHGAVPGLEMAVYRALYRVAADTWTQMRCAGHALTLLAHDRPAQGAWFWHGFGMTVIDAMRGLDPLPGDPPAGVTLRQATPDDADLLEAIEAEHAAYYTQPPVLMYPHTEDDAAAFVKLLSQPENSVWLAFADDEAVGYLRCEGSELGAATTVQADDCIALTGAYTRPDQRGRGVMRGLVTAALADYAARGFTRCSVDFESFNPAASAFWLRYFEPVCCSVTRWPERLPRRKA